MSNPFPYGDPLSALLSNLCCEAHKDMSDPSPGVKEGEVFDLET